MLGSSTNAPIAEDAHQQREDGHSEDQQLAMYEEEWIGQQLDLRK
jgi:hypothetical protein